MQPIIVELPDPTATDEIGRKLASCLAPGQVITLSGELGAGKSALVRAMLRSLGIVGAIRSPTYTLVELYTISSLYFYHFDFYRFNSPDELEAAGFREYFRKDSICFIEWPERAGKFLPSASLQLTMRVCGSGRTLQIETEQVELQTCLTAVLSQT